MSAIAGIVHLDGRPVERATLERMSAALESLGRDEVFVEPGQASGFVSRISIYTAEDRLERQPVALPDRSRILLDGRLDNRDELRSLLGLTSAELGLLSDSALLARAWDRWQRACLARLVGDFALAHWAPAERRLTLARSGPTGKPLFVYRKEGSVYFASTPAGLFTLPEIPRALNEGALGDLLLRSNKSSASLFTDIAQLCNSEWICHDTEGVTRGRHWQPDPNRRLKFRREEEAWEELRPLFARVTASHLRSVHPIGVQMSGGLDSAAIAGQAAQLLTGSHVRLRGYTRVPNADAALKSDALTYNDERPRVELIAKRHPLLEPTFIEAGNESVLETLHGFFGKTYSPFAISPTLVTGYEPLYRRAAADGIRVLLHGNLGNFSISWDGLPRLRTLLHYGRWLTLGRELYALKRFHGRVRAQVKQELLQGLLPDAWREQYFSWRNGGAPPWAFYSCIATDFAHRSGAAERLRQGHNLRLYWAALSSWRRRALPFETTDFEWFYSVPACYGIDFRDPTADRRLVEFCLALPDVFFLKDGIERRLARLGMAHLIPQPLCLDPRWGRQDTDWAARMQRDASNITAALDTLENDAQVCRYLDIVKLKALWQRQVAVNWRHPSIAQMVVYKQTLLGGIAVGQFVRWFEGRN